MSADHENLLGQLNDASLNLDSEQQRQLASIEDDVELMGWTSPVRLAAWMLYEDAIATGAVR